jgi:hypothetical protein
MCHFLLLWVENPSNILSEMARVTRLGGAVMAIAEPDYGGRIDYPPELAQLGDWQMRSLQAQGANPTIGRQLPSLLTQAGLTRVEAGVLGGQWSAEAQESNRDAEWEMLEYDLTRLNTGQVDFTVLHRLQKLDTLAYENGERVLFVPTFYAWGRIAQTPGELAAWPR